MTIVPSEVNENGEVSYVLIVSQPDDGTKQEDDDDMDMSIYDFKVTASGRENESESESE